MNQPSVISTFAGAGGSSYGYHLAGFRELLAIDFEKNACDALRANYPDTLVWHRDITKVTADEIMKATGLKPGELDVLDGSPPCQAFSVANKNRDRNDERNDLTFAQIELIEGLQPKVFVIENVPGMVSGKMKPKFYSIMKALKATGYKVRAKIMNAKYYGVPQSRDRVIIIGVRDDLGVEPSFPEASTDNIRTFTEVTGYDGFRLLQFEANSFPGNRPVNTITKTENLSFIHRGEEFRPPIEDLKALCSFPRDYKLPGSYNKQWERLGNSVMPLMMKAIAEHIRSEILSPTVFFGPQNKTTPTTAVEKVASSPSLTSQYSVCPIPFRYDTYRGCDFGCTYCFARELLTFSRRGTTHTSHRYIRGTDPASLDRWLRNAFEESYDYAKGSIVAIKERIPIKIGAISDPFPYVESDQKITYQTLKVFDKYDYPIQIQTKNPAGLVEIVDSFENPNWTVGVTILSVDQDYVKALEPNAPSPENRFEAIKQLTDRGIPVMVKVQPAIYPHVLSDLPTLIPMIREAGCWAFNTEGLKVRSTMPETEKRMFGHISKVVGEDVVERLRSGQKTTMDYEYSREIKEEYTLLGKDLATRYGLKYFSADNDMGHHGYSSECCGTEVLRDYKINGCNVRTMAFPRPHHSSLHLEEVKVNFTRHKTNADKSLRQSVESQIAA